MRIEPGSGLDNQPFLSTLDRFVNTVAVYLFVDVMPGTHHLVPKQNKKLKPPLTNYLLLTTRFATWFVHRASLLRGTE